MSKKIIIIALLVLTVFAVVAFFNKAPTRLYIDESDQAMLISELPSTTKLSGFGTRVIGWVYDSQMKPATGVITFHTSSGERSLDLIDGNFDSQLGEMTVTKIEFSSPKHTFVTSKPIDATYGAKIVILLTSRE